jgi:beta-glucosidase
MDIGPRFLTASGEIPEALMPDFLHPSAAGYKIWSDELEKVIH